MQTIQYTIRGVSPRLDSVLRKRARLTGRSFNRTVLEALEEQAFGSLKNTETDNFDWLFGAGKDLLDDSFDQAITDLSKPDPSMWK